MVACVAAEIPDRNAAIRGDGQDPLPAMRSALRSLEAAGVHRIAIPCNTAHLWYAALQSQTDVEILHIADAVMNRLSLSGPGSVGILATTSTIASGLYQHRLAGQERAFMVPSASDQKRLMTAIRLVKAGQVAQATEILVPLAVGLVGSGCVAVVMACTEIPVALADVDRALAMCLIDATDALAQTCVQACLTNSKGATPDKAARCCIDGTH